MTATRKPRLKPVRPSGFAAENIPDEIKTAIGELITQWSYVAFQLGVIIRVSLRLDRDVGFALLSGADLQPLCKTLRTIAKSSKWLTDKKLKKDLLKLAEDVQSKKDRRHDFAHGVFGLEADQNGKAILVRYRLGDHTQRRSTLPYEVVTKDLLLTLADEAYDLGRRAQNLTQRLKGRPG